VPEDRAEPAAETFDRLRRRVLWKMPTGLFLIGSVAGDERNLMTANLVGQVCIEPKLVAAAVEQTSRTHNLIEKGACFTVSLIGRDDRAIVRKFVKPATDDRPAMTLNGFSYFDAPASGAPVLSSAVGFLDCRLERAIPLGSHTLFIGEVSDAAFIGYREQSDVLRVEDTRMNYGG
jgi:flavin reductase (DIM6/NTAB) family NADH-FMN oxidoreductase RutF